LKKLTRVLALLGLFLSAVSLAQQNTAKTDSDAGPCTIFPKRYQKLDQRLAWFYGCMHREPPTPAAIQDALADLPPERRALLKGRDTVTQEALIGVANGDLPIQVFPKRDK
jgi:hypothetical protein